MNLRVPLLILLLAALVGGGAYWYTESKKASAVTYTTVVADRGHLQAKVTASGTISALVTVQVGSQVSGRVAQLLVDYNAPVKKGQVLARLDPQLFQSAVAQAQASDVAAESNLLKARVEATQTARLLQRSRQLAARKLIAQQDLDTAQANADAARAQVSAAGAQVAQARATVNQAKLNLTYTNITSPIDGIVISRSVDVGQTVAASLQVATLFVIAQDLRKEQVNASVSEADVGKLKARQEAEFTVAAFPQDHFKGTVRQVRNAATTTQNVVTYDAVIDVENPELKLKPGMTANVSFVYEDKPDALRVPNAALRYTPPSAAKSAREGPVTDPAATADAASGAGRPHRNWGAGGHGGNPGGGNGNNPGMAGRGGHMADPTRRIVWILANGEPKRVPVRIGISDGSFTEITGGKLNEGDPVITDSSDVTSGTPGQAGPGGRGRGGAPMRMF